MNIKNLDYPLLAKILVAILILILLVAFRPHTDISTKKLTTNKTVVNTRSYHHSMTTAHRSQTKQKYINGIDVSHFQGKIDWQDIKRDKIKFVFAKATDGITYIDPTFLDHCQQLHNLNMPFGAYHFFEPLDDAEAQAKHFVTVLKHCQFTLRPVLDIEINKGMQADKIRSEATKWLHYVEQKIGCKPIIYTYSFFWNSNLGQQFSNYDLWLADYSKAPTLPTTKKNWLMWQHSQTGDINGINGHVDLDVVHDNGSSIHQLLCSSSAKVQQ